MAKRKTQKSSDKKDGRRKGAAKELASPLLSEHAATVDPSNVETGGDRDKPSKSPSARPRSKRSQKRARKEALEQIEEQRLTALLFGGDTVPAELEKFDESDDGYGANKTDSALHHDDEGAEAGEFTFEIDRVGQDMDDDDDDDAADDHELMNSKNTSSLQQVYDDDDDESQDEDDTDGRNASIAPAWVDKDDKTLSVNLLNSGSRLKKLRKSRDEAAAVALDGDEFERRLRQRYESTTQTTARTDWARLDDASAPQDVQGKEIADDNEAAAAARLFGSTSAPLLATSQQRLPPNILNIVRCPDANQSDPNDAVVQSVHFHPGSDPEKPLLLTAGLDKTLRFFQVGSESSQKIHGMHFPKMPIYSASFLGDSGNVVVSGRRPFFYMYDAVAGKVDLVPRIMGREEKSWERHVASPNGDIIAFLGNDGYIVLVDAHSKHWITDLKMNGSVRALTFTPDGSQILSSGSDGDVYRWDLRSRRCVERFSNNDGTITSALAASSGNLAVGSESGVVNLYSEHSSTTSAFRQGQTDYRKDPLKSIMNLHTSADAVRFNHDGQMLAMSSKREKHGMKILHVPSKTVFSNWPTTKTPLNYVWSMDFSPKSQFMAIGNDKGKCLLYRFLHYENSVD